MSTKFRDWLLSLFWHYIDNKGRDFLEKSRGHVLIVLATFTVLATLIYLLYALSTGLLTDSVSAAEHRIIIILALIYLACTTGVIWAAKQGHISIAGGVWLVALVAGDIVMAETNFTERAQLMLMLLNLVVVSTGFIAGPTSAVAMGVVVTAIELVLMEIHPGVVAPDLFFIYAVTNMLMAGMVGYFSFIYTTPSSVQVTPPTLQMSPRQRGARHSHEHVCNLERIRDQVGIMMSAIQYLLDQHADSLDSQSLRLVQSMAEAGRRATTYLLDTISLLEMSFASWMVFPELGDPSLVMHLIVNEVDDELRAKGSFVRYQLDPQVPRDVYQDPRLIHRALMTLVENSIRHIDSGWISLRLARDTDPRNFCLIVQDSGVGITEHRLAVIRDSLANEFQVPDRNGISSGIGLALADRIARRLGGRLEIDSQVAQGTTVKITLPIHYSPGMPYES